MILLLNFKSICLLHLRFLLANPIANTLASKSNTLAMGLTRILANVLASGLTLRLGVKIANRLTIVLAILFSITMTVFVKCKIATSVQHNDLSDWKEGTGWLPEFFYTAVCANRFALLRSVYEKHLA